MGLSMSEMTLSSQMAFNYELFIFQCQEIYIYI